MDQPDHEGKRLQRLLIENGKTAKDFRVVLGVSDPAVRKYFAAPVLGAKAWQTVKGGLMKMKLNPNVVREPEALSTGGDAASLRENLNLFDADQLRALAAIMDAPPEERRTLRLIIADRLDPRRK